MLLVYYSLSVLIIDELGGGGEFHELERRIHAITRAPKTIASMAQIMPIITYAESWFSPSWRSLREWRRREGLLECVSSSSEVVVAENTVLAAATKRIMIMDMLFVSVFVHIIVLHITIMCACLLNLYIYIWTSDRRTEIKCMHACSIYVYIWTTKGWIIFKD